MKIFSLECKELNKQRNKQIVLGIFGGPFYQSSVILGSFRPNQSAVFSCVTAKLKTHKDGKECSAHPECSVGQRDVFEIFNPEMRYVYQEIKLLSFETNIGAQESLPYDEQEVTTNLGHQ